MTFRIDDPEFVRLARAIAEITGESPTDATLNSLRERLARLRAGVEKLKNDIMDIGERCAARPILDERGAEENIGYDENGLPD